jgi:DNA-binding NtrC family response regulator
MEDPLTILIIDDEEFFLEELEKALVSWGYRTFAAKRAGAGLAILKENKIDILVLDIVLLPDAHGLNVLREAKQAFPELEVIMVSGYADETTIKKAFSEGAAQFLKKPFRASNIQNALLKCRERILERENKGQTDGGDHRSEPIAIEYS